MNRSLTANKGLREGQGGKMSSAELGVFPPNCSHGSGPPIHPASPSIWKSAATKDVATRRHLLGPGREKGWKERDLEGKGIGWRGIKRNNALFMVRLKAYGK